MLVRQRRAVIAAGALAVIVLLHPPWRAEAVRTTTRYGGTPGLAPLEVTDTVRWPVRWAPIYAPPRAPFTAAALRAASERALSGDTASRSAVRRLTEHFEERYGAPEGLRTAGTFWRDSVLASSGIRSGSTYEATFRIDNLALALRLTMVAALGALAWWRARPRGPGARRPRRPESSTITRPQV